MDLSHLVLHRDSHSGRIASLAGVSRMRANRSLGKDLQRLAAASPQVLPVQQLQREAPTRKPGVRF